MANRTAFGMLVAVCLATGLAGCTIVDQFSDRAVAFNLQSEQAQEQALLLNVVRGMLDRPMQFTTLSTLTGTASSSSGGSLSIPFGHHRPTAVATPDVLGLSETVSGGPTFNVAVLDTQDFYQGLLKPVSGQIVDLYLEARYPKELVLDLLIHKVEISDCGKDPLPPVTFANYPANDFEFDLFQTVLEHLLVEHALTMESYKTATPLGPPLPEAALRKQIDAMARAGAADLKLVSYEPSKAGDSVETGCPKSSTENRAEPPRKPNVAPPKNANKEYQLEKTTTSYRFCFGRESVGEEQDRALCGAYENKSAATPPSTVGSTAVRINFKHARELLPAMARIVDDDCQRLTDSGRLRLVQVYCRPGPSNSCQTFVAHHLHDEASATTRAKEEVEILDREIGGSKDSCSLYVGQLMLRIYESIEAKNDYLKLKFYQRSTESVIYYLGEVARRSLLPDPDWPPRTLRVKVPLTESNSGSHYCEYDNEPMPPEKFGCKNMFRLEEGGEVGRAFLSVKYDGRRYALPGNSRTDQAYPMFEIAKHVFALNTSAKELPATTVLSIIGGP